MTKLDPRTDDRYELAPNTGAPLKDSVPTYRNNDKTHVVAVPKADWDRYEQVADSDVEQGSLL